jgi:hypothetical protein
MPDDLPKSAPETAFPTLPAEPLIELARQAEDLARAALAPATRRAYQASWDAFDTWCRAQGLESLPAPPEALCLYLAWLAPQKSVWTVGVALAAVALAHRRRPAGTLPGPGPSVRRRGSGRGRKPTRRWKVLTPLAQEC